VTARKRRVTGTATVTLLAGPVIRTRALATLIRQPRRRTGSLSRNDMIQLAPRVGGDGRVEPGTERPELMLNQATSMNIADYVRVLGQRRVNGNAANATFQGRGAGNLGRRQFGHPN